MDMPLLRSTYAISQQGPRGKISLEACNINEAVKAIELDVCSRLGYKLAKCGRSSDRQLDTYIVLYYSFSLGAHSRMRGNKRDQRSTTTARTDEPRFNFNTTTCEGKTRVNIRRTGGIDTENLFVLLRAVCKLPEPFFIPSMPPSALSRP